MYCKRVINRERIRRITGSFSWIDHRFITSGFIKELDSAEILLYLFLVTVGDRHGLNFYGDDTICQLLKMDRTSLWKARERLIIASLIEYEDGIYQVLELPRGVMGEGYPSGGRMSKVGDVLREVLTAQGEGGREG